MPGAPCKRSCVATGDVTPVVPDPLEHKVYARGAGMIFERDPSTGQRLELVRVKAP